MNYRRKFQVAVGATVAAILIGFAGVLYTTIRMRPSDESATSAATAVPERSVVIVTESTNGGRVDGRHNGWEYSPERNPSYMKNTTIQQIGYLTIVGEEGQGQQPPTILPLFGQSLRYKHSDRWVYFTATDKYQSIRLPVEYEKRDCMNDDVGCRELYTGDVVTVPSYNNASFTVTVYKNSF